MDSKAVYKEWLFSQVLLQSLALQIGLDRPRFGNWVCLVFNKLIIVMSVPGRINPELSVGNEKFEAKRQMEQVSTMQNRVELLRQQLQKEKEAVRKNKQLTKDAIQKKIEVNQINQWKNKDTREEVERVNQLRKRNQSVRMTHEKDLQDIQKAIYLVKLDDARELKHQSDQHNRRIRDMDQDFLAQQQRKKQKVSEESVAAKQKYTQFWKDKLAGIYTQQAHTILQLGKQKEEGRRELSKLEQDQIQLMEEINKYHSQGVDSKKEYLAALSLPVKDVADAIGGDGSARRDGSGSQGRPMRQSTTLNRSSLSEYEDSSQRYGRGQIPSNKLPSSHVNEGKLKMVLQQLKKVDRNGLHTSR